MKIHGIAALCGLLLASCGNGEEGGASVPLDLGAGGPAPAAEAPAAPLEVATPRPAAEPSAESQPKAAAESASAEALLRLDAWHRAPADQRLLQGDGSTTAALRDFARLWEGGAAAYRAQLEVKPVTVFGPDFERFAKTFAHNGTAGLRKELERGGQGPAYLAWNEALVQIALDEQDLQTAGEFSGKLLGRMLAAGYDRERVLELQEVSRKLAAQVGRFLPAEDYKAKPNDSYYKICRDFRAQGVDAYQGWVADFNGRSNYALAEGERLRIPTATLKLEAWCQARIAALFADGVPIRIYPISVGREETPTPVGEYTIGKCQPEPVWYPGPGKTPVPYGSPDNPLGERWLGFAENSKYAFHGTNSESTIGGFESEGCIRMHNADVTELFEMVGPGVEVSVKP